MILGILMTNQLKLKNVKRIVIDDLLMSCSKILALLG